MKYLLGFALVIGLVSCSSVVRDETVYRLEVQFMEQAAIQQADSLEYLVRTYCKCEKDAEGTLKFTTPECEAAAKKAVVVKSRIPWHSDMMLYNARLQKIQPAKKPPVVPAVSSLCPVLPYAR